MYLIFFALLSGLGYSSIFLGRNYPVLLLVGIIAFSTLMLMMTDTGTNSEGKVVIAMDWSGTEQGTATDLESEIVLLKLEGIEYTVWIWLHVFLIVINGLMFFNYMLREN